MSLATNINQNNDPMVVIRVVVWSDLACPWCYVGRKRLAQAIESFQQSQQASSIRVQVDWRPFQIDPETERGGEDMEAYCRRRWGGSGWTHHLREEGAKSGARFENWKWWPHTGLAHQFVQFGKEFHQADTDHMNSILFQALYESGQNLSSLDTLLQIARAHYPDWNVDHLRQYLEGNQGWDKVQEEIQEGRRQYRVSSVPYFVIGTEPRTKSLPYGLSGAQSVATFSRIFSELSAAALDESNRSTQSGGGR